MVTGPQLLDQSHNSRAFSCGTPALDNWLQKRALVNQSSGASRTYVVCDGAAVVGYHALAVGGITHGEVPGRIRRNMPDPIPAMVLARLAVDTRWQGQGLGADLLRDAVLRTLKASEIAGIRAVIVDAISDDAARFYEQFGFVRSTVLPMWLIASLADLANALKLVP